MLKINLLPPYIYEGKTRKTWIVVWVLLVAVVVGGMLFWQNTINAEAQQVKDDTAKISPDADLADKLKRESDAIVAESAGIRAKNDFVKLAQRHNQTAYPDVYSNVADYTMNGIVYSGITPAQGQVNISAVAPTLAKVGSYVMYMEHNPKINNVNISIADIPGFGAGQPQAQAAGNQQASAEGPPANWHPFTVSLTLAQPIPGAPSFGGGGGGGAGAAGGGGAAPAPSPAGGGASSGKKMGV